MSSRSSLSAASVSSHSSSSSSFVSWCESEHGSLPSAHQRRLLGVGATALAGVHQRDASVEPPPQCTNAIGRSTYTTVGILSPLFGASQEGHQETAFFHGDTPVLDGTLQSEDCTADRNSGEGEEAGDEADTSFDSFVDTPPQIIEFDELQGHGEDTLSSIFDLSLSYMNDEDEVHSENETNKAEITAEGNLSSFGYTKGMNKDTVKRNEDEINSGVTLVKESCNKGDRSKLDSAINGMQVLASEVASPNRALENVKTDLKAKGVCFAQGIVIQSSTKQSSRIPPPAIKTNTTGRPTTCRRKARYVSSSCSTKAVKAVPSFMSPTRASIAKNRGPRDGNKVASNTTEKLSSRKLACSSVDQKGAATSRPSLKQTTCLSHPRYSFAPPFVNRDQRQILIAETINTAGGKENAEIANGKVRPRKKTIACIEGGVSDAVARARHRIRQRKLREVQGVEK